MVLRIFLFLLIVDGCSTKPSDNANISEIVTESPLSIDSAMVIHRWHRNISNQFNIELDFKRNGTQIYEDTSYVKLRVWHKNSKDLLDSIEFMSGYYFITTFRDSNQVSSLSTDLHFDEEGLDNHYGDIVVADFNFDGKDDIALVKESGGNGGPVYNFYIQSQKNRFEKDAFLTDSMEFFPSKIDIVNKRHITLVHASAVSITENIYQLKNGKWKEISHRFLSYKEAYESLNHKNEKLEDTTWCSLQNDIKVRILSDSDSKKFSITVFRGENVYQQVDSLNSIRGFVEPIVEDINADGYNDLKLYYGSGARGSNELHHIFLQNPTNGKLVKLKNSENYPNIARDTISNEVVAYLYHGGFTFMKFKIENYTLIPIESIDSRQDDKYTIKEYGIYKNGKEVIVKIDSIEDGGRSILSFSQSN